MKPPSTVFQNIQALRSEHHVWFVNPDSITAPAQLDACHALLSADEAQRQSRFRFAEDRQLYLVSHALVRQVLSLYGCRPPRQWVFSLGEHGKPEIANAEVPGLRFNLTHTRGLAACIVSLDACGIDAEYISARHNPAAIGRRMFSAEEYTHLLALQGRAQLEYFYSCWTLREAYVKTRGVGIAFPTHNLRFYIASEGSISVRFDADVNDIGGHWQFQLFRPTCDHILATANRSQHAQIKTVISRCYEFLDS